MSRWIVSLGVSLVALVGMTVSGQEPAKGPNPDSQYRIGPDSLPQEGVPKGKINGPFVLPSQAYPGTQHTYWVYVPKLSMTRSEPGGPDGLSGRAGVHGGKGRHASAECDG